MQTYEYSIIQRDHRANIFNMQVVREQRELPRFIRDFIGKGHQLEQKKRQRRRVELQERSLANRVLFLEKQQIKAQKAFLQKKVQLSRIMNVAQRQADQRQAKGRVLLERQKQIEMARQQNYLRRITHRQNHEQSMHLTLERNSLDYKITKKLLEESEKKKRLDKLQDLTTRKERYMTLNLMKEKARSRVDKYFQKKNKEHTRQYQQKIISEQDNTRQRQTTIKRLGEMEEALRRQLEQSSIRVSQMQQIIGNVSQSVKRRSLSKTSFHQSASLHNSPTLITSIEGELLAERDDQVDQKIQQGAEGGVSQDGKVRKRRRNKHANRYRQYEIF